jgi:hypothetical protein
MRGIQADPFSKIIFCDPGYGLFAIVGGAETVIAIIPSSAAPAAWRYSPRSGAPRPW